MEPEAEGVAVEGGVGARVIGGLSAGDSVVSSFEWLGASSGA